MLSKTLWFRHNLTSKDHAMDDRAELEKRISDLETHIAHQDATIQDLSDMTAQQWEIIDALKKQTERLMDRLAAAEESIKAPGGDDPPPPHY